ncbi:RkpR, polysaccharide export protein [Ensifer adhaerens OV14]|nr:RkpR, polysaccharide export protein [Ensifer adhaerens OV14]
MDSIVTTATEFPLARDRARAVSVELRRAARKARASRPVTSGGGGFRTRAIDRVFTRFIVGSFLLIFLIPVSVATTYFLLLASDQFVTEARFAVRSGTPGGIESLAGLSDLLDTGQAKDGLIIADYVKSSALLQDLGRSFDLRKIYAQRGADFWESLSPDATSEEVLKFWRSKVDLSVDRSSGLVTLRVRSFTADDSLHLTQAIVSSSEKMVNLLTRRNDEDSFRDSNAELSRARSRLEQSVSELRDARNKIGILDVEVAAKTYGELLTALRLQLSTVDQSIQTLMREDAKNAPQLVALKARATTLKKQIGEYELRVAGAPPTKGDSGNLAEQASILFEKETERDIAQSEYKSAVAAYEIARVSLDKQRSYLLQYVVPRLAEEALYPRRGLMVLAVFGAAFTLWATLVGIGFMVRDHMAA